jgi:hypothetical protein
MTGNALVLLFKSCGIQATISSNLRFRFPPPEQPDISSIQQNAPEYKPTSYISQEFFFRLMLTSFEIGQFRLTGRY